MDKQCLFDIAIQYGGKQSFAYDIAIANGLSVTAMLTAGQQIIIPDIVLNASVKQVVYILCNPQHIPASVDYTAIQPGGIGYMQIGTTFKVY